MSGSPGQQIMFGILDDGIEFVIGVDTDGIARLTRLAAPQPGSGCDFSGPDPGVAGLPLVDVVLAGEGRSWSGRRYCESATATRLCYVSHKEGVGPTGWRQLRVVLADPATGLHAEVHYWFLDGRGALRSWVRLSNQGDAPLTLQSVTSFLGPVHIGGDPCDDLADLDLLWCENDWLAEGRWQRRPIREALPDLSRSAHGGDPRGRFAVTSTGTWSSGTYLPMGAVTNRRTSHTWAWQIEHNGAWHWQVGEYTRRQNTAPADVGHLAADGARGGVYVALLGPADTEHDWHLTLASGEVFQTVPAAMVVSGSGLDDALGRLTAYRRAIRRPHCDNRHLPVIFNVYMNTLHGDPTPERLRPLIAAAADAGAEYFCIDAGWYADPGASWWDAIGDWTPSKARFPFGLGEILARIRSAGMVPGFWLEPELVGVRSPVAARLPADAFFTRGGQRVVENGRYQLDLRHPAAVKHLNEAVDFVVGDLGAGYLKLDYNINGGPGTDLGGLSAGAGLLAHNRAHLEWLDSVLDRHPGLVIENCASGGMRMDYALLARTQLQSTSDQQDHLRYPPIAAAAPAAVAPEQAAVWAYPQPGFSRDEIAFTLSGAMLGRVHLSGHLDRMNWAEKELVAEALRVYKQIRGQIAQAKPFWPLGLPRWEDDWIALGLHTQGCALLTVWRRDSNPGPGQHALIMPELAGRAAGARILYPAAAGAAVSWDRDNGTLTLSLPRTPSACVIKLE